MMGLSRMAWMATRVSGPPADEHSIVPSRLRFKFSLRRFVEEAASRGVLDRGIGRVSSPASKHEQNRNLQSHLDRHENRRAEPGIWRRAAK